LLSTKQHFDFFLKAHFVPKLLYFGRNERFGAKQLSNPQFVMHRNACNQETDADVDGQLNQVS
jgi:hypothetical protein